MIAIQPSRSGLASQQRLPSRQRIVSSRELCFVTQGYLSADERAKERKKGEMKAAAQRS